jgi:hypothetical protein
MADLTKNDTNRLNLFDTVSKRLAEEKSEAFMPAIPDEVTTFLGKLSMLDGVPIHNIIPHESYLPIKSFIDGQTRVEQGGFKFFYIDPEWIAALLNGALSIADDNDELLLQEAMLGKYAARVYYNETKEKIKRQIAGLYTPDEFEAQLTARLKQKGLDSPAPTIAQQNWNYTGFFIRSAIIENWTGVQIIAKGTYGSGEAIPRRVVKTEKIARDTIFCICEGTITEIEITQPPEAIHFDKDMLPGITLRSGNTGVLDINKLVASKANLLEGNLNTSAAFAMQALSKPAKATLTINRS